MFMHDGVATLLLQSSLQTATATAAASARTPSWVSAQGYGEHVRDDVAQ
jgi:hypothetical protein